MGSGFPHGSSPWAKGPRDDNVGCSFGTLRAARGVRLAGWVGVVFRQCRIHVVPGLGALDENVGVRAKVARVVERADAKADDVRPSRDLDIERRAAIAAEGADDLVAAIGLADIALRGALGDAEAGRRHPHRRDIGGAARTLAVAAMALQREDRVAL